MSSNAPHQSDVNSNVNDPPCYDKDRTVDGAPMKADELAGKCTSQNCGHDAVSGGTQETRTDNVTNRI